MAPKPRRQPSVRFNLNQIMIAVAISAVICAQIIHRPGPARPGPSRAIEGTLLLVAGAIGALELFLLVRFVLELAFGVRCPKCSRGTLVCVTVLSFGDRYFRCPECGGRSKRNFWTVWREVKGPVDDSYYLPPVESGPPLLTPETDADYWQGTTGSLLQHQREHRAPRPGPPREPSGPPTDEPRAMPVSPHLPEG
jgi:hypothetical protein